MSAFVDVCLNHRAGAEGRRGEETEASPGGEEADQMVMWQQHATLAALRVLQKLSNAQPHNFEPLKCEYKRAVAVELPSTGPQQGISKQAAERVMHCAEEQYVVECLDARANYQNCLAKPLQIGPAQFRASPPQSCSLLFDVAKKEIRYERDG